MWKTILIAIDGSSASYVAQEKALALAKLLGSEVVGVFVIDTMDFDSDITQEMALCAEGILAELET